MNFLSVWHNFMRSWYDIGWNLYKTQGVKIHILTEASCQYALVLTQNFQNPFWRHSFKTHYRLGIFHQAGYLCGVWNIKNSGEMI